MQHSIKDEEKKQKPIDHPFIKAKLTRREAKQKKTKIEKNHSCVIILPSHYFYILLPNYLKQMFLYAQLLLLNTISTSQMIMKNEVLLGSHICAVLTPTPPRPSPFCKSYRKKSSRMNAKIHIFIIIIPIIFLVQFFCIYLTPQLLFFLYIFVPMTPQATLLSEFFCVSKNAKLILDSALLQ